METTYNDTLPGRYEKMDGSEQSRRRNMLTAAASAAMVVAVVCVCGMLYGESFIFPPRLSRSKTSVFFHGEEVVWIRDGKTKE